MKTLYIKKWSSYLVVYIHRDQWLWDSKEKAHFVFCEFPFVLHQHPDQEKGILLICGYLIYF